MAYTERLPWLFACGLLAGIACNEDPRELTLCEQVSVKNDLCNVNLLNGVPDAPSSCNEGDLTELQRCEVKCLLRTDCADLPSGDVDADECFSDCGGSSGGNFDCGNGQSVSALFVCDTFEDCTNGADETGCGTMSTTFVCDDGTSIMSNLRCDGVADCPDSSDETGCF